eukprot:3939827-Rhodomonas_salina.1
MVLHARCYMVLRASRTDLSCPPRSALALTCVPPLLHSAATTTSTAGPHPRSLPCSRRSLPTTTTTTTRTHPPSALKLLPPAVLAVLPSCRDRSDSQPRP